MKNPKYAYIYGLKDPRDELIYYVGKSDYPERRRQEHLKDKSCNSARVAWIDELQGLNLEPRLVILQKPHRSEWREAEIYWIARGYEEGWPLVNLRKGGDGGYSKPKPPNYDFMRSYVRPDLWPVFDGLSIVEKDMICVETAGEMVKVTLPVLDHKLALHKYQATQYAMQPLLDEAEILVGMQVATRAVEQRRQ